MSRHSRHQKSASASIQRTTPDGLQHHVMLQKHRVAPLPDPAEMQAYKEIDPLLPIEIMNMAKSEQSHRQRKEDYVLKQAFTTNIRNNIAAILAVIIICGTGLCFLYHGHATEGAGIIIACSVSMAGVFIVRKLTAPKEEKLP